MHRLLALAALMAMAAPANADDFTPVPRRQLGLFLGIHASRTNEISEGGGGPVLEYAFGHGHTQLFTELGLAVVGAGPRETGNELGTTIHVAGGARLLARSFPAEEAAFDLILEAFAGVEGIAWRDGKAVRPMIGGGAGWQVRMVSDAHKRFTVRITTRMFVMPPGNEPAMAACSGSCPVEARHSNYGFIGLFGVGF